MLMNAGRLPGDWSWHSDQGMSCCSLPMRKERDRTASGAMWRWAVHSPTQPVVIPHPSSPPSLFFLSHNPSLHAAGIVPPALFPASTQWRLGAVGAEQHAVWFSLWLIVSVGVLDNREKTCHMLKCVYVCKPVLLWYDWSVWAHCESLHEGTHSLLSVRVSHSVFCPL